MPDIPPTWGGSLAARPRLSGDWSGFRDELSRKGTVLDIDLLLTPQSVVAGGRETGTELWGNAEYTLNIDAGKAGWWKGGYLKIQGNTGFGQTVVQDSGAVILVNNATTFPGVNDDTTALTNATVTQYFSEKFGVMVGKINTIDLGATEFYGDYRTQFLNAAFNGAMTLEQVPASAWGINLIGQPSDDLSLSLLAVNPDGTPTTNPVFGDGIELNGGATLTIRPAGLVGHQGVSVSWNNEDRYSFEQDPSNIARMLARSKFPRLADPGPDLERILERFFPGLLEPRVPPNMKGSSWSLSYSADQYLWQPEKNPGKGFGVFFAFGVSDGNPNLIKYSYLVGLGGKGVIPGRPDDSFGLGYASTRFSDQFVPYLRERLDLGLDKEVALEAYYDARLAGWCGLSADVQFVNPGLTKKLAGRGLEDVNTAVVLGLRAWLRI